jgi:hypothetical protein
MYSFLNVKPVVSSRAGFKRLITKQKISMQQGLKHTPAEIHQFQEVIKINTQ